MKKGAKIVYVISKVKDLPKYVEVDRREAAYVVVTHNDLPGGVTEDVVDQSYGMEMIRWVNALEREQVLRAFQDIIEDMLEKGYINGVEPQLN
eukprot:TRINITY_DN28120_c0_g1_i1.p1 TRINITY_DN28120_c0_g1~~TRINITY_DN28120_c0_g1_i1.p1  ORF type:complete len:104 (+),score=31.76 TRINITY_DN28120_c0_g1_i1:34-312(+)